MAIGSGVSAQFGMKAETTYGTPVTVDRFIEFLSEALEDEMEFLIAKGIGAGRFARTTHMVATKIGAKGSTEHELMTKGCGLLLKHGLGASASAQQGGTPEYLHTYTPDEPPSATVQIGVPDTSGTVRTKTAEGAVVTKGKLSASLGEIVRLALEWAAEQMVNSTALATASFAANRAPFVYSQGALTIGGSSMVVKSFEVEWDHALDIERRGIGATQRRKPIPAGEFAVTGTLDAEFESLTAWNAFLAGTTAQLVLTFTGGTIPSTSNPYKTTVTIPAIYYTGTTPQVGGPEIVRQSLPFKALYNGTNPIITITQNTDDTTP